MLADGTDVLVANPLSAAVAARATALAAAGVALVGSECHSFPMCYNASYERDAAHRACRARGLPTCYANSGLMLSSAEVLERSLIPSLLAFANRSRAAEARNPDQAGLHHLYLSQPGSDRGLSRI